LRLKVIATIFAQLGTVGTASAEDTAFSIFRDVCVNLKEVSSNAVLEASKQHDPSIEFTPFVSLSDPLFDQLYDQKFSNPEGTIVIAMPSEGYDCEVTTTKLPVDPPSVEEFSNVLPNYESPLEPQVYDIGENIVLRIYPFKDGEYFIIYSINYDVLSEKAKYSRQTRVSD
jgi:hypothetical protein